MSNIRYVRYKLGGQYPGIFTELNWSINDLLKCIKNILALVQFIFEHLKGSPLYAIVMTGFSFSFSTSTPTDKSKKILLTVTENRLRKKISCTRLDFGEMLLPEQNGQSRACSIAFYYMASSASGQYAANSVF